MQEKNKKKEKTHDRLATIHEDTSSFFREQLQKQRDKTRNFHAFYERQIYAQNYYFKIKKLFFL